MMIIELTNEEMITTNDGRETTAEDLGSEVGQWVGKALIVWATFLKK